MNNLAESVIQTAQVVAKSEISKLKYDKTKQGKIYSIENLDIGEYRVTLNGAHVLAYAEDVTKTYKIGEAVYVKIPEGDMSNKKIITSAVKTTSLNEAQMNSLANSITDISPTFDKLYEDAYNKKAPYGVIAGAPSNIEKKGYVYIVNKGEVYIQNDYHDSFQQYSSIYQYIRLKASFLTQFHSTHNKGNYGIEVEFYTKDKSSVSYRLDCSNFNGNPYGFSVYSPQEIIIQAQTNYLTGLKSIKLFEENFVYDKIPHYDGTPDQEITDVPNIFVKDIVLQYVDKLDLSNITYYLMIAAPKGIAFTTKVDKLSLVGRLIYQGEDIINNSNVACQWYERDLSVMIGDEAYHKSAGFGWRPLDEKTDISLSLTSDDVAHQQKYKLVAIYNGNVTLTAEVEVKKLPITYDYYIEQVTEGADIKLQLKEKNNLGSLVGNWYLSYPDGSYGFIPEGKNQPAVVVSEYLTYSAVIFYCEVHDSNGVYLGTLEHTITNSENEEDVTISYEGEDNFRYDANGDITIEDAEKERTLRIKLAWKEGYGTSYNVAWLMRNGDNEVQLPNAKESGYNPSDSMLEKVWVDNKNNLHYNIKQKYRVNYNNNFIIVRITTITNSVYSFNKEILFLKDGDQGTNGTTYITAIRPCGDDGSKKSGLQPLKYNNGWQNPPLQLRCYVYKDGTLINDGVPVNGVPRYSIVYKWEGNNVTLQNKTQPNTDTQSDDSETDNTQNKEQTNTDGAEDGQNKELSSDGETDNNQDKEESDTNNQNQQPIADQDHVIVRGIPTISADTPSKDLAFYVKVQVTITDNKSKDEVTVYALYPIDVIIGNTDIKVLDIKDVPSYIKYTSSGLIPSYYSNDINFYYNGKTYNNNIISLNTNLLTIATRNGKKYLEAASSFIFENAKENSESNIGVLAFNIPNNESNSEADSGNTDDTQATVDNRLIHPVIMYLDTYGNEAINGWDGTAVSGTFALDENSSITSNRIYYQKLNDGTFSTISLDASTYKSNTYYYQTSIFAPQIGAGTKDSANRFTGVVMGKDSGQNKIGLYGYQAGVNTFGLMQDGKAFFGAKSGGGQIAIDGTSATLSGGGGGDSAIGMTITLADLNPGGDTYAIKAGAGKFSVTYGGVMKASEGRIGCSNDTGSGGWIIGTNRLYSGNGTTRVELNSDPKETYAIWAGAANSVSAASSKFAVSKTGALYAKEGNIGGWTLKSKSFSNKTNTIGMASSGTYTFWSGANRDTAGNDPSFTGSSYFYVTNAGKLHCKSANIDGAINATTLTCDNGSIGGWRINSNSLSSGSTLLYSTGVISTKTFTITGLGDNQDYTGQVGLIVGNDGKGSTYNLGLSTTNNSASIVLRSKRNISLQVESGNTIILGNGWDEGDGSGSLRCTIPKGRQTGIYARFA